MSRQITPAKFVLDASGDTGTLTLRGVSADRVGPTVDQAFDKPVRIVQYTVSGTDKATPQA